MSARAGRAASTERAPGAVAAVTLDALGTLVRLEDPAPRLQASLAERVGRDVPLDRCRDAMRAEMRHYRDHCVEAVDRPAYDRLRRACAGVLAAALGDGLTDTDLLPCLADAIAFSLYPDVPDALDRLDAAGLPVAVVSNWDVSLHDTLRELGIHHRFVAVLTSAETGRPKPDAALYRQAEQALDVAAARLLHVGDDPAGDVDGARAAGLHAVLLQRDADADRRTPRIRTLAELRVLHHPHRDHDDHDNHDGATT